MARRGNNKEGSLPPRLKELPKQDVSEVETKGSVMEHWACECANVHVYVRMYMCVCVCVE